MLSRTIDARSFIDAHNVVYDDDDEDYSPDEDGNSANGDDPSKELVAIDLQDVHDKAQEAAPPVVVKENEPTDDDAPEASPAAD